MRLITLSDNTLLVEQHRQNSKKILRESCDGLTLDQRRIVKGIHNELSPLLEVALSADQIKNIFQSVEKNATAAGSNRTGLGKGVDTVQQVDTALNKLGKWLQDTTPVKSFDTKFAQLKSKVSEKFPELDKKLTGMGTWAKANPGKTAAIIGVLTTLAALAGGPVGGAIAGQILKGSTELLKGEKLSTAIGKGAKAAAYGFLAGKSIEAIGDMMKGGLDFVADKIFPGLTQSTYIHNSEVIWNVKLATQDAAKLQTLTDAASKAMMADDPNFVNLLNKASKFVSDTVNQPGYYDNIVADAATAEKFLNAGNAAAKAMSGIGAAAQGAVTAKTGEKKESYYVQSRSLSEGQVYLVFNRVCAAHLNEGVFDKIKTFGKNLTTKVTADKLNSAWQKAGAPTDSNELSAFLKAQGVSDDVIASTYAALKIPTADTAASTDAPAVKKQAKLGIGQINKILPTLRTRDLLSIQKTVVNTIAGKQTAST
jgi:hypothetical protein